MKIRLIIFLVLTVSNRVLSQLRLVVNTTCLKLAKPSNQQLRLSCRQYDYHCLLDETFTKEFEVCREWRWIFEGKCAYFNTYGRGNIDERNCIPKNNLTCSQGTVQFSSATNTKYTACYAKKEISTSLPSTTRVPSQSRLLVKTTCLELAKPSNQQLRLSCSNPNDYHCLLDESYTQEYEACRDWKWIPTGKCAFFNTYGEGNVDERNCIPKNNLTCSHGTVQFSSATNTKYTACYDKKYMSTSLPVTTRHALLIILPIILGIIAPLVSLAVIYLICMHLKYVPLYRKAYPEESGIVMNEDTVEQEPFLRNETKDSSESPPTIKHEDENITGARKSGHSDASDPADMNESDDLSEHFGDALSSPTNIKQKNSEVSTEKHQKGDYDGLRTIEVDSNICKSAYVDISKDLKEGVSTTEKSDNEERDTQELTDVFDDTVESLQRIAHPTDEQDVELCLELYKLLDTEGRKLMQEVMAATITRETGKSVKTLKEQEKNKLKAMLPEESHRVLESITEHDTSIHVSYGLHRIILDEEKSPKSGWGNPVRETDTSIGDDVERLYRIQTIVQRISNPVTLSVESYIRLLDIMIKALIRLDHDGKFKEDYKLLSYKLKSIKNPNLTQTMLKTITDIAKKFW
nr:uncharacterized protein LOC105333182 isoform X2 [Crassostrea gigas]